MALFTQIALMKVIYSRIFRSSFKIKAILAPFVEHSVSSNLKEEKLLNVVCWFWFVKNYPTCTCKRCLFLKFQVLHERSSDIASFLEHPVYNIFKIYNALILFFNFDLPLFTRNPCVKVFMLEILFAPRKKQWCTPYIAFSKYILSWYYILILIFHYLPKLYG